MYYARDAHLKDIPLTQTGEVRQEVIHRMNVKEEYRKNCINLIPNTLEDYKRLCKVFSGGFTHATRKNT